MPRCSICKTKFKPKFSTLEKWCSEDCEYEYKVQTAVKAGLKERERLAKERKKKDREVINKLKEKHKDGPYYKKILQAVFNTFIKLRDKNDGCISCGTKKPDIQYAAGHFFTVGSAPALRYNEDNVHRQCNVYCNDKKSGNIANYRPNLIKKIGQDRFDYLESQKGVAKHYTVDELKELIVIYRQKIKELSK